MKRIALAFMMGTACMAANAMEQLPDDALSDSTGQSGLTIEISPITIAAEHVRYYDGDGFTGFLAPASVDIGNLTITTISNTLIRIDVASTGTGPSAKTALFLFISPTLGMSVTTGNISTDSGNELAPGINVHSFAQFSATNMNISAVNLMLTGGGAYGSSGLTLSTVSPVSLSADVALKDTVNGGVISSNLSISNFTMSNGTVDIMTQGQGIQLGAGNSGVESISFGDVHVGPSAFTGGGLGTMAVRNLNFTGTTVSVVGH